jgi:chromosome partitioning protein
MSRKTGTRAKVPPPRAKAKSSASHNPVSAARTAQAEAPAKMRAGASAAALPKAQRPGAQTATTSRRPLARIIAVCNQKGGCGKTTSIINIAAALADTGHRVLVVDLDSQCNASMGLGWSGHSDGPTALASAFDMLVSPSEVKAKDVTTPTAYENLFLIPGSIEMAEFESRVASEIGRENRLKKALAPVRSEYDFILLDTPPSLGLLSVNALNAATEVQIAMQSHPFALDGVGLLLETIGLVQAELNPDLVVSGVYITMFDSRTRISQDVLSAVSAMPELKGRVFRSIIRQNVKVTEAAQARQPVMYYDPACTGTEDYRALAKEIARQSQRTTNIAPTSKKSKERQL